MREHDRAARKGGAAACKSTGAPDAYKCRDVHADQHIDDHANLRVQRGESQKVQRHSRVQAPAVVWHSVLADALVRRAKYSV